MRYTETYKSVDSATGGDQGPKRISLSSRSLVPVAAASIIMLAHLIKFLVASAVIVPSTVANPTHYNELPYLLEADVGTLASGLHKKLFTSVDLVNVSIHRFCESVTCWDRLSGN